MIAQTSAIGGRQIGEIVVPQPWPQIERLQQVVLKLAHDMTNSLVVSVSHTDLALLTAQDPEQIAVLQQLRPHIAAPFAIVKGVRAALPGGAHDGVRTLFALQERIQRRALVEQIQVFWHLDLAEVPPGMTTADWTHVVHLLVENAFDAHLEATCDLAGSQPISAPEISVVADLNNGIWLRVADNGPGCSELRAAATGQLVRAGKGHLGLGLTVAASLCAKANLDLVLQPNDSKGLVASVRARS